MEVYSDTEYKPESVRGILVIFSLCFIPFQLGYVFASASLYAKALCGIVSITLFLFPLFSYLLPNKRIFRKRIDMMIYTFLYFIFNISMFIINSVIVESKYLFDPNFNMFCFLILSLFLGGVTGYYFSEDTNLPQNRNVIIRYNEIEIRKIDVFGALSLQKMPFLKAPLKKMRNALYVVAFFIGTGGAGIGIGIAELLKRSDVISPELGVHSVLFFSLGVPILFTFGVLIYSMVAYLLEWRKLIAGIEKEFGGHKIIFNSQKKSYKKIKEILDSKE